MKTAILAFLALGLVACPGPVTPKPAPIPQDTNKCADAEKTLERLQCKDLRGDPMWVNRKGERFQKTCETAQEDGRIFLNPKCISDAPTCEEAKQCPTI